jgi:hypothetical protein
MKTRGKVMYVVRVASGGGTLFAMWVLRTRAREESKRGSRRAGDKAGDRAVEIFVVAADCNTRRPRYLPATKGDVSQKYRERGESV